MSTGSRPPDPARAVARMDERAQDPAVRRIRTAARWLDERYLDPIIGFLLPGLGDVVPGVFGVYVLFTALRLRLPAVVIARMMLNIAADVLLGLIPVAGDLFDIGFKANRRNAALLEGHHQTGRSTVGDWLLVGAAAVLLVAILALPLVLFFWGAGAVHDWLS